MERLRPRHGGNLRWAAGIANCERQDLLDFSASIAPFGLPDSARAAMAGAMGDLVAYPDPSYAQLRGAIAQHHSISPDWILPGNGAAEILTYAARSLAICENVWIQRPGFADYDRALAAAGVTKLQALNIGTDPTTFGPRDGLLLNNPHNPTGALIDPDWIRAVARTGAMVVVDEAFMDFLPDGPDWSVIPDVVANANLIVIRSLTKFYAIPGLRLGYGIVDPSVLAHWQGWRDPWSVNTLAAAVGVAVLGDRPYQARIWSWLSEAKPLLVEGLQKLPGLSFTPGAANFLLVKTPESALDLQRALLVKHRIVIRDCMSFPELGEHYFRVALRRIEENQRLVLALAEVLADGFS
jgi:L-threonine-O-3-phosphate decarboxylase